MAACIIMLQRSGFFPPSKKKTERKKTYLCHELALITRPKTPTNLTFSQYDKSTCMNLKEPLVFSGPFHVPCFLKHHSTIKRVVYS